MESNLRIVGVVQARLGSSRLPRKVVAPLGESTMLEQIVRRIAGVVDDVVVATTTDASDDALVAFCEEHDLACSRGPVDDIVQRFWAAGAAADADVVVRVWGDCPFVDPDVVVLALERMRTTRADYVNTGAVGARTFPIGLDFEVYTAALLQRIVEQAEDPFHREFPYEWVSSHATELRLETIANDVDLSHIQLTVDYPEDLQLAQLLYERLGPDFRFAEVVALVEQLDSRDELPRNIEYHQLKKERGQ